MTPSVDPALGIPVVYLVDDGEVVRGALAWLLRTRRSLCEAFATAEAVDAWLLVQIGPARARWPTAPSCLLLDVRMLGLSGLAPFERVAERGLAGALPVISRTGHGDMPTAVAAVKRGAFDFLEKPLSNNALVDRVEQALAVSATALQAPGAGPARAAARRAHRARAQRHAPGCRGAAQHADRRRAGRRRAHRRSPPRACLREARREVRSRAGQPGARCRQCGTTRQEDS